MTREQIYQTRDAAIAEAAKTFDEENAAAETVYHDQLTANRKKYDDAVALAIADEGVAISEIRAQETEKRNEAIAALG